MKLSCQQCRELLAGEAENIHGVSVDVASHLESCADCARFFHIEYSMLRNVVAELRDLPTVIAPKNLRSRIQEQIAQEQIAQEQIAQEQIAQEQIAQEQIAQESSPRKMASKTPRFRWAIPIIPRWATYSLPPFAIAACLMLLLLRQPNQAFFRSSETANSPESSSPTTAAPTTAAPTTAAPTTAAQQPSNSILGKAPSTNSSVRNGKANGGKANTQSSGVALHPVAPRKIPNTSTRFAPRAPSSAIAPQTENNFNFPTPPRITPPQITAIPTKNSAPQTLQQSVPNSSANRRLFAQLESEVAPKREQELKKKSRVLPPRLDIPRSETLPSILHRSGSADNNASADATISDTKSSDSAIINGDGNGNGGATSARRAASPDAHAANPGVNRTVAENSAAQDSANASAQVDENTNPKSNYNAPAPLPAPQSLPAPQLAPPTLSHADSDDARDANNSAHAKSSASATLPSHSSNGGAAKSSTRSAVSPAPTARLTLILPISSSQLRVQLQWLDAPANAPQTVWSGKGARGQKLQLQVAVPAAKDFSQNTARNKIRRAQVSVQEAAPSTNKSRPIWKTLARENVSLSIR